MNPGTFEQFKTLVYQKSGITLSPQKVSLVSARIARRIRTLGLDSHEDYFRVVVEDRAGDELLHLLDSMSTNVTGFFREPLHFHVLEQWVREWRMESQPRLRVWCAASSTGEEPYSLAMTVLEAMGGHHPDFRLLATDMSTRVLETARRGRYTTVQIEPVPRPMIQKYFQVAEDGSHREFRVRDEVRRLVTFRRLNLVEAPFPMNGPFDLIFCRNVMIYFDTPVRHRLVLECCRLLRPGGYVIISHSESLLGLDAPLALVQPSIYRKAAS